MYRDRDVIGELKCVKYGKKQGGEKVTNGKAFAEGVCIYAYTK